jgi:hypothetical protein
MDRRRFLAAVGTALLAGATGCVADGGGDGGDGSDGTATPSPTPSTPQPATDPAPDADVATTSADAAALRDVDLPLSDTDLKRGAAKDAIPAVVDPVFGEDWSGVEASLEDDERVIGVTVDGVARAYPLAVLNWHEVVNDSFGGPLLVTYCPLCGSGVTAERRVDGEETVFGVSGYLWMSDLVMYDRKTESLWSQVLGKAVQGPRTGTSLSLRPSSMTTWGQWREEHPDTTVLLPPPESNTVAGRETRNYDSNPYAGYENDKRTGLGGLQNDDRLHPKTTVLGVATDGTAKAYPFGAVDEAGGVVNDAVGDLPVVVATSGDSLVAYVRRVDGETLEFSRDGDVLTTGGSRWGVVSGRARDGPHEGTTLEQANDRTPMFWFAWSDFFPDSTIYGQSG